MEKALVDQYYGKDGEIVNDGILCACILNQTDIKSNKNKFYIIQLIKTGNDYNVFIRYGRIGERGVTRGYICGNDMKSGVSWFAKEFKTKTGNIWSKNIYSTFQKKDKKYFLTQLDMTNIDVPKLPQQQITPSKLCDRIQNLIKLLSDVDMMSKAYVSLNLDPKKMPLGKIDKKQLDSAKEVLKKISESLNKKDDDSDSESEEEQQDLTELSSQFYTYIPYSVGRRKPPVISSNETIDKYMQLLDELEHMVVTASITNVDAKQDINKLDQIYDDLHATIEPLDKEDDMWKIINEYVKVAPTHNINIEIIDIYELKREGESKIYNKHNEKIGNKMLLWHGSGLTNWLSIIKNGYRLPHTLSGVVLTGWMFGAGTYFSNMFSKSFNYTRYSDFDNYACLSLSEVALGIQHEITNAECDIDIDKITKYGCHSTYGMGTTTVKPNHKISGVIIPAGEVYKRAVPSNLLYDEFIVYDTKQIKQKYIVIVKNKK